MNEKKRKLPTSDIGTVVDKSKAKYYFPIRETVFQKGSRLNRFEQNSTPKQEGGFHEISFNKLLVYGLIVVLGVIQIVVILL